MSFLQMFSGKQKEYWQIDGKTYLRPKVKLGLALSGGGTRGIAYVGILRAFEEAGIVFDCVAGTSVGSMFGAMYCAGVPSEKMEEVARSIRREDLIDNRILKMNSRSSNIERLANRLLADKTFDDLQIPFKAVAVDIVSGDEVVLESGNVSLAVSASCAVPVLFTPVTIGENLLVDGGLLNNMPADVVRAMGADFVVSVDLNHLRGRGTSSTKLWHTLPAIWSITTKSTMYKGQMNSDVIIEPEMLEFDRTALDKIDERIAEGYRAATERLKELPSLLNMKELRRK